MNKTKKLAKNIVEDYEARKRIFRGLLCSFGTLFLVYIYLIGSITFNVLSRKSLESEIRDLNSKVGELELASLNLVNDIDIERGIAMGFVRSENVIFVPNTSLQAVARR